MFLYLHARNAHLGKIFVIDVLVTQKCIRIGIGWVHLVGIRERE